MLIAETLSLFRRDYKHRASSTRTLLLLRPKLPLDNNTSSYTHSAPHSILQVFRFKHIRINTRNASQEDDHRDAKEGRCCPSYPCLVQRYVAQLLSYHNNVACISEILFSVLQCLLILIARHD